MQDLLGGSILSFVGLALVLFGIGGWMMGQALALTWRSIWLLAPYAALLAATARFLDFSLFGGDLGSWSGFLCVWLVVALIAAAGFRATRAGQMAAQYPWLFERVGPFTWRSKS